jgi:hypothetical protein
MSRSTVNLLATVKALSSRWLRSGGERRGDEGGRNSEKCAPFDH